MKKILVSLIILLMGYLIYSFTLKSQDDNILINLGFEKKEIIEIQESFTEENISKLVSLDDKNLIYEFINSSDFDSDKLDSYINFYNEHKEISVSKIIKLVNNDIDTISDFVYDDIIIDLLDEKYYILHNTTRYIDYFHENKELSSSEIVANVNSNIDNAFYTNINAANLDDNNLILVNKFYYLPEDYEPTDLVYIDYPYSDRGGYLKEEVYSAFREMVDAASSDGISLYSVSPYRSYTTQKGLYEWYASSDGYENADTYSARAGFSEHQTGLAIDINSTDDSFAYTKEAKWLENNAYKFGFILRYPKGKEYITGYQYEPWHYRYVGTNIANEIYELGITFEEYYAYFVA